MYYSFCDGIEWSPKGYIRQRKCHLGKIDGIAEERVQPLYSSHNRINPLSERVEMEFHWQCVHKFSPFVGNTDILERARFFVVVDE
jgi:hypothetical protein